MYYFSLIVGGGYNNYRASFFLESELDIWRVISVFSHSQYGGCILLLSHSNLVEQSESRGIDIAPVNQTIVDKVPLFD